MKYVLTVIVFVFTISAYLYSYEPIENVPDAKPDFSKLNRNDLQREFFNYYSKVIVLKTQIQILNQKPDVDISSQNINSQIFNNNAQLIAITENYYNIALALKKQILSIPESKNTDAVLKKMIEDLQKQLIEERMKTFDAQNSCFQEKMKLITELTAKCEIYLNTIESQYALNNKHSTRILSVSPAVYHFYSTNNDISSNLSMGVHIDLNASPILSFGKYFDVWGEYIAPKFKTENNLIYYVDYGSNGYTEEQKWDANIYSLGLNLNYPNALEIFHNTAIGFKIGYGHYWGNGKIYNSYYESTSWKGDFVRFEANLTRYKWFFPLELYAAYNLYLPSDEVYFNNGYYQNIDYGKSMLNCLSVGVRFTFLWHPDVINEINDINIKTENNKSEDND